MLVFGPFRLDAENALLYRGTRRLDLSPKAAAVLCYLVSQAGRLVPKDELLQVVWGHSHLSSSVLKNAIAAIRSALSDDPQQPRYVETVPWRGYRFIEQATAITTPVVPGFPARHPWVERSQAMAELMELLNEAHNGRGGLVLVAGEAGVGKTALISRCCACINLGAAAIAGGQCVEQIAGGEPFLPILDALSELVRGDDGEVWKGALRTCAPSWLARLPWIERCDDLNAEPVNVRMPREFGMLLDVATSAKPLLLVIEDLHWSDHATIDLLRYLARRRVQGRWLVLVSYRPIDATLSDHPVHALRAELGTLGHCHELVLGCFSENEVGEYLEQRLEHGSLERSADLTRLLHKHTEGLPLFLTEVVSELISTEMLSRLDGGAWCLSDESWRKLTVPETVGRLIERRLKRLPPEDRQILDAACILGTEFAEDVLALLVQQSQAAVRLRCDDLALTADWLTTFGLRACSESMPVSRYAFRHVLYRRVLLANLGAAKTMQYHLAAASALLQLKGDPPASELAHHFESARDVAAESGISTEKWTAEARKWRIVAGRQAKTIEAIADALQHYQLAFAGVTSPLNDDELSALIDYSELLRLGGQGKEALHVSAWALCEAKQAGSTKEGVARLCYAKMCIRCDRVAEGLQIVESSISEGALADPSRAEALLASAEGYRHIGDYDAADKALQAALAALPEQEFGRRADILLEQINAYFERDRLQDGLALTEQARKLYEAAGDATGAARVVMRHGAIALNLGLREEALAALEEGRRRMARSGDVAGWRSALLNLAKIRSDGGDARQALTLLDEGWQLAPDFETPVAECAFLTGYFYCHYLLGDLGATQRDAERILRVVGNLTSLYWRAGALIMLTDFYCQIGALQAAQNLIDETKVFLDTIGEHSMHARLLARQAWLDILQGHAVLALERLGGQLDAAPIENFEDRLWLARVRAQAQLACGDALGARNTLAEFGQVPTRELSALMLALRLEAGAALGDLHVADSEEAIRELDDQCMPALEGLVLCRALAGALSSDTYWNRYRQERARLADTLSDYPQLKQDFCRAFPV